MKKLYCLGLSLMLVFLCGCSGIIDREYRIFEDISQCEKIVENKSEDAIVTVMESPSEDKMLKKLSYNAFWGCEYTADDLSFTLYAYVFPDHDTACKYFRNVTGKRSDLDQNFSYSWQMGFPRTILLSDNRVCTIYTLHRHESATYDYLNSIFTEKMSPPNG